MRTIKQQQGGMFLIEALIAILIFALGILGMMAMGGAAVTAQSDAQYRTEASNLAEAIASEIALNVDRTTDTTVNASLPAFAHQAAGGTCSAGFTGGETGNVSVQALAHKASAGEGGLPGADTTRQQIKVEPGAEFNRVTITLCWRQPNDTTVWRQHVLVTYVNGGAT